MFFDKVNSYTKQTISLFFNRVGSKSHSLTLTLTIE